MVNVVAKVMLKTFSPVKREIKEQTIKISKQNISLSETIVKEYHKWLGASERYPSSIAPHLFPMWSYPSLYKLGKKLHLPLHKVLNQGVKMTINQDLPLDQPLNLEVDIYKIKNMENKIRLSQKITTGTAQFPEALISEIHAVILKNPKAILAKTKEQPSKVYETENMIHINSLYIAKEDAQSYAYLSGDINPIHLSQRIAKLMGLKGSIMHGFGLYAMLYENLKKARYKVKVIDVRFLSPVYLESTIHIYISILNEEKYAIKIFNREKTIVHLSGEFFV